MSHRRSSPRFLQTLVALLCFALSTPVERAHAYHELESSPTYLTGHVLPRGDVQLGLDYISYGLGHRISVNAVVWGYLLPLVTGDFVPNLSVKIGTIHLKPFYFAFETGLSYLKLSTQHQDTIGDELEKAIKADFFSIPISGLASYHPNDEFLVSMDIGYFVTNAKLRSSTTLGSELAMMGSDSLQGGITAQYALTKYYALTFKARTVLWAPKVAFEASGPLNDEVFARLNGNIAFPSLGSAYQVLAGVAFSWEVVNLRLGFGYGNVFLPTLGMVSGYQGVIPDFEFNLRF